MNVVDGQFTYLKKTEVQVHPKLLEVYSLLSEFKITLCSTAASTMNSEIFFSRPVFVVAQKNKRFLAIAGVSRLKVATFQADEYIPVVIVKANHGRDLEEIMVKSVLCDLLLSASRKSLLANIHDCLNIGFNRNSLSSRQFSPHSSITKSFEKTVMHLTNEARQPVRGCVNKHSLFRGSLQEDLL